MNTLNLLRKKLVETGNDFKISVAGQSMEPSILNGDIINITYKDIFGIGDVVVFFYGDNILVHRIVKIHEEFFYCKGDNSFRIEKITQENILGEISLANKKEYFRLSLNLILVSFEIGNLFEKGMAISDICKTLLYKKYEKDIIDQYEKYNRGLK